MSVVRKFDVEKETMQCQVRARLMSFVSCFYLMRKQKEEQQQ